MPANPTGKKDRLPTEETALTDMPGDDGRDPDFAASLRSLGPVTLPPPLPSTLPRSRQDQQQQQPQPPALVAVAARQRLARAAQLEAESVGRPSHAGREFLDVATLRQALALRDQQGLRDDQVERSLRLKPGVLRRLGVRGVVQNV